MPMTLDESRFDAFEQGGSSVGIRESNPGGKIAPAVIDGDGTPPRMHLRPLSESSRRLRRNMARAVLLDLEGVLVNTHEAFTLSWLVGLHDCGHHVPIDLLRQVVGMAPGDLVRIVAGLRADSPEGMELQRMQQRNFRTWYLPRILPYAGVGRLLRRMRSDGLRLVALSVSDDEVAAELVRASGVAKLLDDVAIAHEDLPGTINLVVSSLTARLECSRREILLLGDSPHDVWSAGRCGIDSVALRCTGWTDRALDGAAAIYGSHDDLLMKYGSSPFRLPTGRWWSCAGGDRVRSRIETVRAVRAD